MHKMWCGQYNTQVRLGVASANFCPLITIKTKLFVHGENATNNLYPVLR